jgi:hypothetical protein
MLFWTCNYRSRLSMCYDKLLLGGRRWMQWTMDGTAPRSYPATKTSLQTPTLRVCAWTTQLDGKVYKVVEEECELSVAHTSFFVSQARQSCETGFQRRPAVG